MKTTAQLDPALNTVPRNPHRVYLIGICGTGMAGLAAMLQQAGFAVSGSDENIYPPMSDFLSDQGIAILPGYSGDNLRAVQPDLVIVGNVVRAVNPEAVELERLGLPYLSMPQALAHFFLQHRMPLVVAGTHGKTTTSSLLATALHRMQADPGFMIGGLVEAFGRNCNIGSPPYFVVEGDEYDTAFFNKVSKFQHYRPHCAILTSVEFDHADIFPDLAAIKRSFAEFIQRIPPQGVLVACGDDPVVRELASAAACPVLSYGAAPHCQWRLANLLRIKGLHSEFTVLHHEKEVANCKLPMPGRHNSLNALAVLALLHHLGFPLAHSTEALATFEGVKRRQQIRGEVGGITVIDDFAHHPTAVRETLAALHQAWPDRRLVAVFEPRTNSSRRAIFQKDYVASFDQAEQVFIREHIPLDTVPIEQQFSSRQLAADLRVRGVQATACPDSENILDALVPTLRAGDVVAILSNGGFDNIHQRLLDQLRYNKTS